AAASRAAAFAAPAKALPLALRPEASDATLAELLRIERDARLDALEAQLAAMGGHEASAELLAALRGDYTTELRQPPLAARSALAKAVDPDTDVRVLVNLFESDPALTQALLRRANSALLAGNGAVMALREAVQRIGLRGVHSVIVEVMLGGLTCRAGPRYDPIVQDVWSHMVRTAPIARALSPCFGTDPESTFTLALLHDVGKLVVFDRLSALRTARRRDVDFPDGFLESVLRVTHEPVGGLVLLAWGLGGSAARAVATHHRAVLCDDAEPYSQVLCLAERQEHLQSRGVPLDVQQLWQDAQLSGSIEWARVMLGPPAAA
ncbi:MAG: HDOD domain-containing protein, partial [Gemmatimonadales bacterium]|nr:HDOD domain-containing protein [Gemmatimonadales bacterium]